MGVVFFVLVVAAILAGLATGRVDAVTDGCLEAARTAVVDIALPLVGVMAFFLGLMEVAKRAGLMPAISRGLRPIFRRLFPDVPDGHPALASMTMNVAANMMGLGNAATPFGIRAMTELDKLNTRPGTATDAMVLFLAINTSSVSVFPSGTIGLREAVGSADPAGIILPTWIATVFSTVVGIAAVFLIGRLPMFRRTAPPVATDAPVEAGESGGDPSAETDESDEGEFVGPPTLARRITAWVVLLGAIVAIGVYASRGPSLDDGFRAVLTWNTKPILVLIILAAVVYAWARGVRVYEALVHGGKDGFQVAIRIVPFLVAILVAVGMFRAAGLLDLITSSIAPVTSALGFPAESLPMALMRPLSGSGAMAVMVETMQAHGPDSFIGYHVATLQGSTETTFYTLAVYGGAVGMRRARHAIAVCLTADFAGAVAATAACHLFFG
jgi:spore maturation protein SpmA